MTKAKDSPLILKFQIVSSDVETLPPGEYSYYFEMCIYWYMRPVNREVSKSTTAQKELLKWFGTGGGYLIGDFKTMDAENRKKFRYMVSDYLLCVYGDMTLEEMQKYALDLFNIENFQPDENVALFNDGKYTLGGHGGTSWSIDFISERKENDKTYVTVQYYADSACFIKSYQIEFELQEKDGKWAFLGSKTLNDAPYKPYTMSA